MGTEYITWTVTIVLIVIGFAGVILPMVPGLGLIYLATAMHKFAFFTSKPISWTAFFILTLLFVAATVVEFTAGFAGAQKSGLTKHGFAGGITGLLIGLFFPMPGILLGPPIGMFLAQWKWSGQEPREAWKTTLGYLVGTAVGVAIKIVVAILMVGVFAWAVMQNNY